MTFTTVLIANRGEIARRIIRAANSMGLRSAAVFVDADAASPHVADADLAIRLDTGYLDADAILDAARRAGADAIHPGYGYLSENAAFAQRVIDAGLTWVGPSPDAIASMGDKLEAKRMAQSAGVPVLVSTEDPSDAASVGYPLMIKAAAGGGGKGMRIVHEPAQLDEALAAARREALGGFGDDRVFIEHYVARSRHIEIQIIGDHHGTIVQLGERECSIQRRHQKLVEESPSPFVDEPLRAAMGEAALALARTIGYQSAGTVEFLVDDDTREFYFLEVNARLQVEHPVTEEVTGIDLVREQFRIAMGEPLGFTQGDVTSRGWAIEVRLCAEDPVAGFLPATGTIRAFEIADAPVVRLESGVVPGSVVSVNFDPMLAKVIAYAPTRGEAASTLALALERMHLGGVTTNRDFLVATLRHHDFLNGATTTQFIEQSHPARALVLDPGEDLFLTTAAALWLQGRNRSQANVLADTPSGWRNARLPDQRIDFRLEGAERTVTYRRRRDGTFLINGEHVARVYEWNMWEVDLDLAGRRAIVRITADGEHLYVQAQRGTATIDVVPRFVVPGAPVSMGGLNAPMPGVIIDVRVAIGDVVTKGQTLVVMEAMKMEHVIVAPHSGTVSDVLVAAGRQVENGAVLLVIDTETGD